MHTHPGFSKEALKKGVNATFVETGLEETHCIVDSTAPLPIQALHTHFVAARNRNSKEKGHFNYWRKMLQINRAPIIQHQFKLDIAHTQQGRPFVRDARKRVYATLW